MLNISRQSVRDEEIEQRIYAFRLLQLPSLGTTLARLLTGMAVLAFAALFLPWTQNIPATGRVTAFAPTDRPYSVPAVIGGRIMQWYVQEGQYVEKGDTIFRIGEIKPEYMDPQLPQRLAEQIAAKEAAIRATEATIEALRQRLQVLRQAAELSLQKARNKMQQVRLKVTSDSTEYEAQKMAVAVAENQYARYDTLYDKGLVSLTDLQKRQVYYQQARAKLTALESKLLSARQALLTALVELAGTQAEYREKILKAESEMRNYEAYLSNARLELATYRNKYASTLLRNEYYYVLAPTDGYIVKVARGGVGEVVKAGEPVVEIQPARPQKAVELYIHAMDVPLVQPGARVRIEFAGWPAFQFAGWPSVSVGTFGGQVAVVDYVSQPDGTYRLLVVADTTQDPDWPEELRIGSAAKGFILLQDVPVWFELWRQLNGFPPSLDVAPPTAKSYKSGKSPFGKK